MTKFNPLNDDFSSLELIDSMGNDLSVVNDARVSYDNHSDELGEGDIKLINFLIKHQHFSPLRGVVFKFKIKMPLYIARQFWKHVIASAHTEEQLQWNEVSFRYTQIDTPEFYIPSSFKTQSKSNKQQSGDVIEDDKMARLFYESACHNSAISYQQLLDLGVSREQARGVLNPCVYTSFIWTTSLQATLNNSVCPSNSRRYSTDSTKRPKSLA
jgi:thymidylate synthase (FAD)